MRQEIDELCGIEPVNWDWIEGLRHSLSQVIRLDRLILFGSRAIGEHTCWSDYDLCVIAESFQEMRPWERMELVLSHWGGGRALEAICYTPEEFERLDNALVKEIKEKGRPL